MKMDSPPPAPLLFERLMPLITKLCLAAAALLAMIYIVPHFLPTPAVTTPAATPATAESAPLEIRIQDIEARIKALESAAERAPDIIPAKNNNESHTDVSRLAEVERQLADVKKQLSGGTEQLAAVTLFYQIKDAITRGESFRDPWTRLNALAKDQPAWQQPLTTLAAYADSGVPTLAILQLTFGALIPKALAASPQKTSIGGLDSLIRIRKVGEIQAGGDDESAIARAEAKLARGEVKPAMKELSQLTAPATGPFSGWMKEAESYASAREALLSLQTALAEDGSKTP